MFALVTGFVAGVGHVISGPDHWVAIAPFSVAKPSTAMRTGVKWGFGHGAAVVLMGLLGMALRESFSMANVSHIAEISVGVLLVLTGIWAIWRARVMVVHSHGHDHEDGTHSHYHVHLGAKDHDAKTDHEGHGHAATGIGFLHGIAGSGHLWGLIPALSLPAYYATMYLIAFIIGSTLCMTIFAYTIGRITRLGGEGFLRKGMWTTGLVSIVLGGYWCFMAAG